VITPEPDPEDLRAPRGPDETQDVSRDTDRHASTRISGRAGDRRHETTVFRFRDPRAARPRIYRSGEGLPWAVTDLAKRMNSLIGSGQVDGEHIKPGDIVQAAVVSYYCGGKVLKPQTTPDSPAYATLPYRIVVAEGGYWTAEPALPAETLVHFALPATVGELIPGLSSERRDEVIVSLQLKEATHASTEVLEKEAKRALTSSGPYAVADEQEHSNAFRRFLEASSREVSAGASDDWRDLITSLGEAARDGDSPARTKKRLSDTDRIDFGFGKLE
jgi:hypothetical protein